MPTIISLLQKNHVFAKLKAESKESVLTELIQSLSDSVDEEALEAIQQAVFEREQIMSTGVGKGLAIPHGKTSKVDKSLAAFALLDEPIPYEAIDDEPVEMIFLLVGPQSSNSLHIKLLSRISRLMNNAAFRDKVKACDSAAEIVSTFENEEQIYFG